MIFLALIATCAASLVSHCRYNAREFENQKTGSGG